MTQKYIKIEKIGEGACGTVYKAKDTETNQIVAIKKYKYLTLNEGIPQNCLREIQVLRSLEFRKDVAG
jgi:serine/threonine protein kinase